MENNPMRGAFGLAGEAWYTTAGTTAGTNAEALNRVRQAYRIVESGIDDDFIIEETVPSPPRDDLEDRVYQFLRGENPEGITQEVVDKFFTERKKIRHLNSAERSIYHKPKKDGKLLTSKVDLKDIFT